MGKEHLNSANLLAQSERNVREAAKQSIEQEFQNVLNTFENEKSARRTEVAQMSSLIDDCRMGLLEEVRVREMLEDRYTYDLTKFSERIDDLSCSQSAKFESL